MSMANMTLALWSIQYMEFDVFPAILIAKAKEIVRGVQILLKMAVVITT